MRRRQHSFITVAGHSFAFVFGGIWLLCGVPFLVTGIYVGIDTMRERGRYQREARVAEGIVLTKRISRSRDSTSYHVGYRFSAEGTVVTGEAEVSGDLWDRLVEREPLAVTYLPGEPRRHRIEGEGPSFLLPAIHLALAVVLVPLGGWIFSRGVREVRRQLRLQRAPA